MERTETLSKTGQILLTEQEISTRLKKLADQVQAAYLHTDRVVVIVLLNGAKRFADELFNLLADDKFEITYVKASSYGDRLTSSGNVQIEGLDKLILADADVLIVDDIYDSGLTMTKIVSAVSGKNPQSIRTCVLLAKQAERTNCVEIDFKAAEVDDCFVIGYGLDYNGQYRDLPFIAKLEVEPG